MGKDLKDWRQEWCGKFDAKVSAVGLRECGRSPSFCAKNFEWEGGPFNLEATRHQHRLHEMTSLTYK